MFELAWVAGPGGVWVGGGGGGEGDCVVVAACGGLGGGVVEVLVGGFVPEGAVDAGGEVEGWLGAAVVGFFGGGFGVGEVGGWFAG